MNKTGPILVIEDDLDDQDFLRIVFEELNFPNEVIYFVDGQLALDYLRETPLEPFIIISDINMPRLNGLALKEQIQNNEDLRFRCIPYLFFTTSANQAHVIDAYSKSVQGFFVKPQSITVLKETISAIMEYWLRCESPNYIK
jgi:CheY-like chemotaxis protein